MLTTLKTTGKKANMCSRTYWLAPLYFILLSSTLLSGCEKSDSKLNSASPTTESSSAKQKDMSAATGAVASINKASKNEVFAPTVKNERRGRWHGGPPPINKQASGIDTFYQIKPTDEPNHLMVTLRFEGVIAEDARVEFKPIDGAKFLLADQRSRWRLTPDIPSQLTLTVVVPDGISYIAINTYQHNNGAARAIELSTR